MIGEGETAPSFELPAVVDGDLDRIALEDYVGREIVILAFYPGDFNPACRDGTTDLDELDLFTMQKDVSILGISTDSVYAHQAFADQFDLHIPLLSDPRGEVSTAYGVVFDEPADGHVVKRAVVVVGLDGTVEFAWATEGLTELPPVERIRSTVDSAGGERTAEARYGVGHAHYVEGRRQFTSAMSAFEDEEWMIGRGDFTQAKAEFSEAADDFNTAARFAEAADVRAYFERAEAKAEALWQAAEWLAESADAYASGKGATGISMREDAEKPLEAARDIHDPVPPEEFPPDEEPADLEAEPDEVSIVPDDDKEEDAEATLEIDVNDAAGPDEAVNLGDENAGTGGAAEADSAPAEAATAAGSGGKAAGSEAAADGGDADDDADDDEDSDDTDDIDEAELEEITAELEQQTEAAEASASEAGDASETQAAPDKDGTDGESAEGDDSPAGSDGIDWESASTGLGEAGASSDDGRAGAGTGAPEAESEEGGTGGGAGTGDDGADAERTSGEASEGEDLDEEDLELDLTDPSEGEDELLEPEEREVDADGEAEILAEDEDDDGGDGSEGSEEPDEGNHGVPDSL